MAMFNYEDFLIRRGINPNAVRQQILDVNALLNKFKLGESGPLNTPYRPNFVLGQGNYNAVNPPSTVVMPSQPKQIGTTATQPKMIGTKSTVNPDLDTLYGKGAKADGGVFQKELGNVNPKVKSVATGAGKKVVGGVAGIGLSQIPTAINWNKPGSSEYSRFYDSVAGLGDAFGGIAGGLIGGRFGTPGTIAGAILGGIGMDALVGDRLRKLAQTEREGNMTYEEYLHDKKAQEKVEEMLSSSSKRALELQRQGKTKQEVRDIIAKEFPSKPKAKVETVTQPTNNQPGYVPNYADYEATSYLPPKLRGFDDEEYDGSNGQLPLTPVNGNTTQPQNNLTGTKLNTAYLNAIKKSLDEGDVNAMINQLSRYGVIQKAYQEIMENPEYFGTSEALNQYMEGIKNLQARIDAQNANNQYQGWVADPLRRAHVAKFLGMTPEQIWGKDTPQNRELTALANQYKLQKDMYEAQKAQEERNQFLAGVAATALGNNLPIHPMMFANKETAEKAMDMSKPYVTEPLDIRTDNRKLYSDLVTGQQTGDYGIAKTGMLTGAQQQIAHERNLYNTANQDANRRLKYDLGVINKLQANGTVAKMPEQWKALFTLMGTGMLNGEEVRAILKVANQQLGLGIYDDNGNETLSNSNLDMGFNPAMAQYIDQQ